MGKCTFYFGIKVILIGFKDDEVRGANACMQVSKR